MLASGGVRLVIGRAVSVAVAQLVFPQQKGQHSGIAPGGFLKNIQHSAGFFLPLLPTLLPSFDAAFLPTLLPSLLMAYLPALLTSVGHFAAVFCQCEKHLAPRFCG